MLQSTGLQRVGQDRATEQQQQIESQRPGSNPSPVYNSSHPGPPICKTIDKPAFLLRRAIETTAEETNPLRSESACSEI